MAMELKKFFNPIQKAQVEDTDNSLMRFKKLSFITAIGGYHSIDISNNDSDIPLFLRCLMPNLEMIWDPRRAYESSQHLGIGTFLTNPVLALVLLVRVSVMNEEEEENQKNESARLSAQHTANRTGWDQTYIMHHTDNSFLKFQLVLLSIIAMLIDALKMIVTYALVLPALPIALPIMKYLDYKRSTGLLEVEEQPQDVEATPNQGANPTLENGDENDLSSSIQIGKSG